MKEIRFEMLIVQRPLVSTITNKILDGRGLARSKVFKHQHEKDKEHQVFLFDILK